MKPFKNLDEQIEILKSRGLKFNDENKAKKYLDEFVKYNPYEYDQLLLTT